MTPFDPVFLLLPILQASQSIESSATQYRTAEDILDESAKQFALAHNYSDSSPLDIQSILDFCSLRCAKESLMRLCDVKNISPEITVYRFSPSKSRDGMRAKVAHLEKSASFDASRTIIRNLAKDDLMEDGREELLQLGRTRACCDLISQYLSPNMRDELISSYNLNKLQTYLNTKAEEVITKAASDLSQKQKKAAKDAVKKSESVTNQKRKPAKPSQGVEKLRKASTTGMTKLSSFFSKA